MQFLTTPLIDLFEIRADKKHDDRGWFMRSYCQKAFAVQGVDFTVRQCNISHNPHCYTLRGMHFQQEPKAEAKLVRCTHGRIFDVAIDLRPHSLSYCQWYGVELSADAGNALFIPEGFAHGFLTLEADSQVFYQMGEFYDGELACGVRYNDPAFAILWPASPRVIGERDQQWPDYLR